MGFFFIEHDVEDLKAAYVPSNRILNSFVFVVYYRMRTAKKKTKLDLRFSQQ
jgi:hypothetical protein